MSFSLYVADATQNTLSDLTEAVPQTGGFEPTFTTITGITGMSNINTSYCITGALVTVNGMVTILTQAVAAPYQFSMTLPLPIDTARQNYLRGSATGFPQFGGAEMFTAPIVFDLVDERLLCTVQSSDPAAATARQIVLCYTFSYFMDNPNPLAAVIDLPL
jgi:hypothetical protein